MNVLVDTSVWVAHFKQCNAPLVSLLDDGLVVCHPHVIVEVACGTPPAQRIVIDMLAELESLPVATPTEMLELIERRGLHGRGCGFVDVNLLASAMFSEATFVWTLDKRLEAVAIELGRAYRPSVPP